MSTVRGLLRLLAVVVIVGSLLLAGRILWVGYGPAPGPAELVAQTAFLRQAVERGDDVRMQRLFPEGAFFTVALTASATTTVSAADLTYLRSLRDRLEGPELTGVFGSGMVPEHGIFQAGWSLAVAVDLSARAGDTVDRDVVRERAVTVAAALQSSPDPFLASYPGQIWPCDTVVAVAALARAAILLDRADWTDLVRAWRTRALTHLDPATGLLPHRLDPAMRVLEGPRGSSQSIVQAFWPEISAALGESADAATWSRFVAQFVTRRAGLVGVREFPVGTDGPGDVDSGPLVLGVSASASAVGLAAARAVGDRELAQALDREAELLGLPLEWSGRRRYAFGLLPVGDAFLAWARSRPLNAAVVRGPSPNPQWSAGAVLALVPAALAGGWLMLFALRSTRYRRESAPAPPRPSAPPR